jgi:hypothetical protein
VAGVQNLNHLLQLRSIRCNLRLQQGLDGCGLRGESAEPASEQAHNPGARLQPRHEAHLECIIEHAMGPPASTSEVPNCKWCQLIEPLYCKTLLTVLTLAPVLQPQLAIGNSVVPLCAVQQNSNSRACTAGIKTMLVAP